MFARLQSLTDCVILFDEIEEFCLDRESPGLVSHIAILGIVVLISQCYVFIKMFSHIDIGHGITHVNNCYAYGHQ